MATVWLKNGVSSVILRLFIPDKTSVFGEGKTGLAYNSSGLIISTIADNEAAATNYTQAGSTIETISTLGTFAAPTATKCRFKEVDATYQPGLYELQIADARWAVSGARYLDICLPGVSGLGTAPVRARVQLTAVDPQDATRFGLTALPNAAAEASGGLFTRGTGAGQINQDANGRVDVSLRAILGTTLTETSAGYIASAFKKFFDVATAIPTVNNLVNLVRLLARKDSAAATDFASELTLINTDGGSGAGDYANTTDSQEAIRDNMATVSGGVVSADVTKVNGSSASARKLAAFFAAMLDATDGAEVDDTDLVPTESRFQTTLTSTTDNHYAQWQLLVLDGSGNVVGSSAVKSYNGSTKVIELYYPLPSGAPAAGDDLLLYRL